MTERARSIAETPGTVKVGDVQFLAHAYEDLARKFNYSQLMLREVLSKFRGRASEPVGHFEIPPDVEVPTE